MYISNPLLERDSYSSSWSCRCLGAGATGLCGLTSSNLCLLGDRHAPVWGVLLALFPFPIIFFTECSDSLIAIWFALATFLLYTSHFKSLFMWIIKNWLHDATGDRKGWKQMVYNTYLIPSFPFALFWSQSKSFFLDVVGNQSAPRSPQVQQLEPGRARGAGRGESWKREGGRGRSKYMYFAILTITERSWAKGQKLHLKSSVNSFFFPKGSFPLHLSMTRPVMVHTYCRVCGCKSHSRWTTIWTTILISVRWPLVIERHYQHLPADHGPQLSRNSRDANKSHLTSPVSGRKLWFSV